MLNDVDKQVLNLLLEQQIVTKEELNRKFEGNGFEDSLKKLKEMEFVEKIESLGTCFVITKRGMRAMKSH